MTLVGGEVAPLSVLHIGSGRYPPGDRDHATFAIWRALASGFDRYTVVGRSTAAAARIDEGALSVRLVSSRMAREAEFLTKQFAAVRIADEVGADVVIAQSPAQGGPAAVRIGRRRKARTLMELHMSHYVEPAPLASRSGVLQAIARRTLPHADRIRVLSDGMRDRLIGHYGAHLAEKVRVLPPRVDLARFSQVKTDWRIGARPRLAIVGGITARKGQLRLINALFAHGVDAELWLIGDGPDREACRAAAADLGAADRVRFFGRLTHAELAAVLPTADALVCFSSMEGTPRAIMEAMAVGLPVLTTDAGFCADVVEDGVEGWVLRGDAAAELRRALGRLLSDDAARAAMGRAARARAERDYDAVKLYAGYRALICETANL